MEVLAVDGAPVAAYAAREVAAVQRATSEAADRARERVLVGLEFGGPYGMTFAYYLAERGFDVVSVRPKDTNEFTEIVHRRTGKTDEKDAQVIARLTADGNYLGLPFPRPEYAELRQLVSAIDRTTKARTACVNRVRGALQLAWPEFERTFPSFTKIVLPLALLGAYPTPDAIGVARKLLRVMYAVARSGETYDRAYGQPAEEGQPA